MRDWKEQKEVKSCQAGSRKIEARKESCQEGL